MLKKTALFLALFFGLLIYFVFSSGWYAPAKLIIKGKADLTSSITVQWDSGNGFNQYEQRTFSFLPFRGDPEKKINIEVSGTGETNKASKGSRIALNEIRIDDRGIYIPPSATKDVNYIKGHGWYLNSDNSTINLDLPATQGILFSFKTSSNSGVSRISINGNESLHDLYRRNWEVLFSQVHFWLLDDNDNFTISFILPRYRIKNLVASSSGPVSFTSAYLNRKSEPIILSFDQSGIDGISIANPNKELKHYFHPLHFFLQTCFALLVSVLVWIIGAKIFNIGNIKQIFLSEHRWWFWLYFSSAFVAYSLWLMAFWPGVMSVDSLNVWRAAQLPEVMINNHPFVNELWYFFLSRIWNNIAIVPITQIVLLSILIASTFLFVVRRGVPSLLLVPFFLVFLSSIPIGLYNTTLWKDVPFALLVVFWSLVPAYLYLKKRNNEKIQITKKMVAILLLSFLCLITFRHNGLVYLLVIPMIMFALGLVRVPRTISVVGLLAGICLCYIIVFPPASMKSASYFHDLSRKYLYQLSNESLAQRAIIAAKSYPRLLDIKKNQEYSDFWHSYLNDRYAYRFLREVGWSDVYPYRARDVHPFPKLREFAMSLYKVSLEYPWLYLSWYPFVVLYLFLMSLLLCRRLPLSAIFSTVIITQVAALLLIVGTANWRYYYFVLLGGYFLLPIMVLEMHLRKQKFREGSR